jgi:hypothetical protein
MQLGLELDDGLYSLFADRGIGFVHVVRIYLLGDNSLQEAWSLRGNARGKLPKAIANLG